MTTPKVMEALGREAAYCVGIVIAFGLGFGSGHVAATTGMGDLGHNCRPDGTCNTPGGRRDCLGKAADEHTCPYRREINDDNETLCECCDNCAYECAMDV